MDLNPPEIVFDASSTREGLLSSSIDALISVRGVSVSSDALRLVPGTITLNDEWNLLILNSEGSILLNAPNDARAKLITPKSVAFFHGGSIQFQLGRGAHEFTYLVWQQSSVSFLEGWLKSFLVGNQERWAYVRGIDPTFSDLVTRFDACLKNPITADARMVGLIYDAVPQMVTLEDQIQLAPLPSELPDTIALLVKRVAINSAAAWPLKDASDQAGYSPFHFSRVFKSMVGYGFHEYVERCRTANAIKMLLQTETSVDSIATISGFGTTQGLRESIKQYLGLVPSELRMSSEVNR